MNLKLPWRNNRRKSTKRSERSDTAKSVDIDELNSSTTGSSLDEIEYMEEYNMREAQYDIETVKKPIQSKVHIIAPATLPEGYSFEATIVEYPKLSFPVTVPPGGIQEGEIFLVPIPTYFDEPQIMVKTGRWKDPLFACFRNGIFHPSIWCAMCCTQIAAAQVMTRLRFTWLGGPGPEVSTKVTFRIVVTLVFCYMVYTVSLDYASVYVVKGALITLLKVLGTLLYTAYSVYALMKLRENIRAKYSIPEKVCHGCEDLMCAAFCSCCTVAQLSRHTGEFETYRGSWCAETGLSSKTPICI